MSCVRAATQFEALSADIGLYARRRTDRSAKLTEEALANARAYMLLGAYEDNFLRFPQIESFRGFAATWMKGQSAGYRDYDRWCKSEADFDRGRAKLTERMLTLVDTSGGRPSNAAIDSSALRLFDGAEFSVVPAYRVRDLPFAALRYARLFPREDGVQAMVFPRDHPPPHVHIEFLNTGEGTKLEWPSRQPLTGEKVMPRKQKARVAAYLDRDEEALNNKVKRVFGAPYAPVSR